ncbi:MAG: RlmE family RNA methyltransferase [Rhodospirillales bacterium]
MSRPRPPRGGGGLTDARPRSASSRRWLERQIRDPYVAEAKRLGYRSRAAFKLIELDDRFHLLAPGRRVLDLGAAPGGWSQVAVVRVRAASGAGRRGSVVALDLTEMVAIEGASIVHGDAMDEETLIAALARLGGPADVVLSDMAPPATGHAGADHLRIIGLAEAALEIACRVLAPGGSFVCKVWQGGSETELLTSLKRRFARVRHAKPPASRPDSAEVYVVAQGFRPADPAG